MAPPVAPGSPRARGDAPRRRGRRAGSAGKDFARTTTMPGPSPVKRARTVEGAAEDRVLGHETALVDSASVTLVSTGRSRRAERRPAMSRPS